MKVVCTYCNTTYNVPNQKMPTERTSTKCKKCGGQIIVEPGIVLEVETTAGSGSSIIEHNLKPSPTTDSNALIRQTIVLDYPELRDLSSDKFALEEILTPNKKGGYKTRGNKLKLKVFKATSELLDKILKDGEKVVRIGKGTALYPVEIFFGNGFLTMMYNHYAIVCTNRRLLFININSKIKKPTHYLFQMFYDEIKKVKRGLFGNGLMLYRKKGKHRSFQHVKGSISKELKQFIADRKDSPDRVSTETEPPENLCPSCFVPLKKGLIQCPQCQARFKEPKKALFRSLLLPGLGDMYLGHRGLGIFELMGSIILWMAVILSLLPGEAQNFYGIAIVLLIYNGVDGMLTHYMAKKGYMLAK